MSTLAPLRSRHSRERASWPARARRLALLPAAALVAASAVVVLAGVLEVETVMAAGPGEATSQVNGALAFLALGVGLLCRPGSRGRRLAYAATLLVGMATLAQYVLGVDLGIDELLADAPGDAAHPGRPGQGTTIGFTALALSGLLAEAGRRVLAQVTAGSTFLMGITGSFGYVFGVESVSWSDSSPGMSATGALAMVAASALLWLQVPQGALQWVAFGTDGGARSQRVLVPVALGLIPAGAWLFVEGLERDLYSVSFGTALLTTFTALVVVVVGYRTGRTAFLMDLERDTLLDELHRVNGELEDRVRGKVHQLNRQRTKLALFEERDRIARDLHDRVIQRIFAAGLQTASLGRTARKQALASGAEPTLATGLDQIAVELDMAIRELRNSIFELTSIGDNDNLEQVVREIAGRAARILGFMPRIDVRGEIASINADLLVQIASVIQEALSNVARHARASAAEVAVVAGPHDLQVRITDDGVGLPDPLPRSSGISNLMNRARQLGGTATWANGEPAGTVVTWRVPREGQPLEEPHGYDTAVADSDQDQRAEAALTS